jgi:hypothetical protein
MADEIDIEQAASDPRSASDDAGSVQQHSLPDLIEADKYLKSKSASARKGLPIRMFKLRPPGASGVDRDGSCR